MALGTRNPAEARPASHASPMACVAENCLRHPEGNDGASKIMSPGTSITHRLKGSMVLDRWMWTRLSAIGSETVCAQ